MILIIMSDTEVALRLKITWNRHAALGPRGWYVAKTERLAHLYGVHARNHCTRSMIFLKMRDLVFQSWIPGLSWWGDNTACTEEGWRTAALTTVNLRVQPGPLGWWANAISFLNVLWGWSFAHATPHLNHPPYFPPPVSYPAPLLRSCLPPFVSASLFFFLPFSLSSPFFSVSPLTPAFALYCSFQEMREAFNYCVHGIINGRPGVCSAGHR